MVTPDDDGLITGPDMAERIADLERKLANELNLRRHVEDVLEVTRDQRESQRTRADSYRAAMRCMVQQAWQPDRFAGYDSDALRYISIGWGAALDGAHAIEKEATNDDRP